MEEKMEAGMPAGVNACDADLFERVWERVGAREKAGCPVEIKSRHEGHDINSAEEKREDTERMRTEDATDDFPAVDDLPCLGRRSDVCSGQLQRYIREELSGWQLYRWLARKVNGPHARSLAALASEKHGRAKKLAAAHFLIAGVRYWPVDELGAPRIASWLGTLREQFSAEQRSQHRYRAAAYDTEDPCLCELYSELAEGCAAHAALLRSVIENVL